MKRPLVRPWRAVRDERGQWQVVNANGSQPLRSSDPMERILAAHLAAAAPELKDVLERMTRRMEHLMGLSGLKMDEKLVQEGWGTVIYTKPPYHYFKELAHKEGQRELGLDGGEPEKRQA